jgi:toxin ParE1/3/4
MSRKIVRHDAARSDITSEAYYIAEDNLDASDRFLQAVEDAFRRLADFPGMGVRREYRSSTLQDLKMWPVPGFENYLIFYKATEEI